MESSPTVFLGRRDDVRKEIRMRKILIGLVATAMLAAPTQAAHWQDRTADARPGAFVGARVQLPLGHNVAQPRASLGIAPTQSRISSNGMVRTRIGEGLALNLNADRKPTLTLAGVPAGHALGLETRRSTDPNHKAGISTGGWIAIGVGTAVVAGAVAFALWVDAINDNSD
jgi:hypothetical protein